MWTLYYNITQGFIPNTNSVLFMSVILRLRYDETEDRTTDQINCKNCSMILWYISFFWCYLYYVCMCVDLCSGRGSVRVSLFARGKCEGSDPLHSSLTEHTRPEPRLYWTQGEMCAHTHPIYQQVTEYDFRWCCNYKSSLTNIPLNIPFLHNITWLLICAKIKAWSGEEPDVLAISLTLT